MKAKAKPIEVFLCFLFLFSGISVFSFMSCYHSLAINCSELSLHVHSMFAVHFVPQSSALGKRNNKMLPSLPVTIVR